MVQRRRGRSGTLKGETKSVATDKSIENDKGNDVEMDLYDDSKFDNKAVNDPIPTAGDKTKLLNAFLRVKGLVKQHVDSFNYFIDTELKNILKANEKITSDVDPMFYLKYTAIRVGMPSRQDTTETTSASLTPQECRLRDLTYSAQVFVDVAYVRGKTIVVRKGIPIGRLPIMLRSSHCVLTGKNEAELAKMDECPLDPGGYFVVKGTEKVILVQEQLSKNRIIVELDRKGQVCASVTSSTTERKSKTSVVSKGGCLYLQHNSVSEEIPIVVILKAMGLTADREIAELVGGNESSYLDAFAPSMEEATKLHVFTQQQALEYIGARVKVIRRFNVAVKRTSSEEALDMLATLVLAHIQVDGLNFRPKCVYIALMIRRIIAAMFNSKLLDDRDFLGNKRLELYVLFTHSDWLILVGLIG